MQMDLLWVFIILNASPKDIVDESLNYHTWWNKSIPTDKLWPR